MKAYVNLVHYYYGSKSNVGVGVEHSYSFIQYVALGTPIGGVIIQVFQLCFLLLKTLQSQVLQLQQHFNRILETFHRLLFHEQPLDLQHE